MGGFNLSANRSAQRVFHKVGFIIAAILLAFICAQPAAGSPTKNQEKLNHLIHSHAARPSVDHALAASSRVRRESEIPPIDATNWSEHNRGNLTYRIVNYPSPLKGQEKMVDEVIAEAFDVWSSALYVEFWPKEAGNATFEIEFVAKKDRSKSFPSWPKVSPMSSLVRNETRVILFDDTDWAASSFLGYKDFRTKITVHEIGHALGLKHNDEDRSVMATCIGRMFEEVTDSDRIDLRKIFGTQAVVPE